ncbi:MAG: glycosyltransferase [Flavobacteriales bacterium]|nr:glycosyltransferase [Flavobacteriales bacterium]
MYSILIPVYNYDVRELVSSIHLQAEKLDVPFEIIVLDDASTDAIAANNQQVASIPQTTYEVLPMNVGRGSIRKKLAERAQFNRLLFLDCDVQINNPHFIANYLDNKDDLVVIGGIAYQDAQPNSPRHMLRWLYGTQREQKSALERSKMRFSHFVASNIMIDRKVFLDIPLDEEINGYGHEDTMLGLRIIEKGIQIKQIDNPVTHLGLDDSQAFLEKSLSGVKNLARLYKSNLVGSQLKLIKTYERLNTFGIRKLILAGLKQCIPFFERNLLGPKPNLRYFDLWKLYHFAISCE